MKEESRSCWAPSRRAHGTGLVTALIRQLRPDRYDDEAPTIRAKAVSVEGAHVLAASTHSCRVEVRLNTDIRFPQVMGTVYDIPDEGDAPDMYDNRELSHLNAPR